VPQKLLYDVSTIDPERVEHSLDEIRKINPHRHEFEQLTAILLFRPEEKIIVGLRDVRDDEFWVRGHIPGRPLLPGVLMLEAAAQLCSFYCGKVVEAQGFLGFAGIDEVRFRGVVTPGQRMLIAGVPLVLTPTRCQFETQGVVAGKVVFDATILGVRIR
jgi:3-hydroxyacyl-[acyl-carrier-protein] dehydratase